MRNNQYISIQEMANILGISRIAVYKKVKKGQIEAIRIGRSFAIPKKYADNILGKTLDEKDKKRIDSAVKKMVKEYGKVLELLGRGETKEKTVKVAKKFLREHLVDL